MSRFVMRTVGAAAIALLALVGCSGGSDGGPYSAETLSGGERVSLADLEGRPALITSWGTWCHECKELLPALEELHRERGHEIGVIAVNVNAGGDDRVVEQMVADFGLTMPQWRDRDDRFSDRFRAIGVPTTVLLDARGEVLQRWPGSVDPRSSEVRVAIDSAIETATDR